MRYYGHAKSLGETSELDCVSRPAPPRPAPRAPRPPCTATPRTAAPPHPPDLFPDTCFVLSLVRFINTS